MTQPAPAFPLVDARGPPRALGRAHGEQAATRIRAHLEHLGEALGLARGELRARAARFEPEVVRHCPHLVEELHGLAEGAGIAYADALAVNVRAALGPLDDGCTAFAAAPSVTGAGTVLAGQTSDTVPQVQALAYVLRLRPTRGPAMLMWTFGGMLGYHGLNALGVAHFANDLGGGPPRRHALPHYPFKRMLLECADLDACLALFERVPLASNGNYVLCDGAGRIADVEATTEGADLLEPGACGFLVHANHFLGPRATPANHARSAPDSFARQARLEALLSARRGALTTADACTFLRDREGAPTAILRSAREADPRRGWEHAGVTVAALVAEPARGLLHVAAGNDPAAPWSSYSLDGP